MEVMTIRQYAQQKGVSYEAIRKQIKRYQDDLRDHIIIKNRTMYLDEQGVEFLDKKRNDNSVISRRDDAEEELKALRQQVDALRSKIVELQEAVIKSKDDVIALSEANRKLTGENVVLLEDKTRLQAAILDKVAEIETAKQDRENAREAAEVAKEEATRAKEEAEAARKDLLSVEQDRDRAREEVVEVSAEKENAEKALEQERQKTEEAEREAASYHKSWFGFYRKA